MKKLNIIETPWYKEGLSFKCTGCGGCCTGGPGYCFVNLQEMEEISKFLNISLDEFTKKYIRKVLNNRFSLLENPKNFDCVFLKEKKCQIYPVRPTQCRTFPFWPKILSSKDNWEEAAKHCEGINPKEPHIIPYEEIEKQRELQEQKEN